MKPNCWDCEHFERVRMYAYCHGGKRVTKLANKYWYSGTVKFCSDFKPHVSEKAEEKGNSFKELEVTLTVKVKAVLEDSEATEQTVRFLIEEDLRDKGWDADVEVKK